MADYDDDEDIDSPHHDERHHKSWPPRRPMSDSGSSPADEEEEHGSRHEAYDPMKRSEQEKRGRERGSASDSEAESRKGKKKTKKEPPKKTNEKSSTTRTDDKSDKTSRSDKKKKKGKKTDTKDSDKKKKKSGGITHVPGEDAQTVTQTNAHIEEHPRLIVIAHAVALVIQLLLVIGNALYMALSKDARTSGKVAGIISCANCVGCLVVTLINVCLIDYSKRHVTQDSKTENLSLNPKCMTAALQADALCAGLLCTTLVLQLIIAAAMQPAMFATVTVCFVVVGAHIAALYISYNHYKSKNPNAEKGTV